MPETREITVYAYAELSTQGKANAQHEYNQPDEYWYEGIREAFIERGVERGFDIDDIQWSGFGSQGDGASWTGRVYLLPFLAYHLKPDNPAYARYMVLVELVNENILDAFFDVVKNSFLYNHDQTIGVHTHDFSAEEMLSNAKWHGLQVGKGILEGADIEALVMSIDLDALLDNLQEWTQDEARGYARDIYKALEGAYDDYSSEEYFLELCEINEWRFDASGKIVSK